MDLINATKSYFLVGGFRKRKVDHDSPIAKVGTF
jgi:hypothetical protein